MFTNRRPSGNTHFSSILVVCGVATLLSGCATLQSAETDRIYPDLRFSYRSEDIGTMRLAAQAEAAADAYCGDDRIDPVTNYVIKRRDCIVSVKGRILETVRERARENWRPA